SLTRCLTQPPATSVYPLSLHDALPISDPEHFRTLLADGGLEAVSAHGDAVRAKGLQWGMAGLPIALDSPAEEFRAALGSLPDARSEEHTSELQSRENLVCRLLLEKKKS